MPIKFAPPSPLYEVQEILEETPLSQVYLAHRKDNLFKMPVVIKLFQQTEGAFLQMESLLRARNSSHLVKVLSFERIKSRPALVLEYIAGATLKQIILQNPLNEEEKHCVLAQVLMGLKELKKAGLAHGDLSLSNVLINKEGEVYLTDYGLANYAKELYGTEPFLAPELYTGIKPGFASDLFSLGVLEKVLSGAFTPEDLASLKSEHFICPKDPLLDPYPQKRTEKPFAFSKQAQVSLSEKVVSALLMKSYHPPLALKSQKLGVFSRSRFKTLLGAMGDGLARFWAIILSCFVFKKDLKSYWLLFLGGCWLFLVLAVDPFVSYGQYQPKGEPAQLLIRTQRWLHIEIAEVSGYTPLTIPVKVPGAYKLKWRGKGQGGVKYIYLKPGQQMVLTDKDFP